MQHLQRVDGVHHLLVDLCHHRGEHLHGEVPGENNFPSDSRNKDGFLQECVIWAEDDTDDDNIDSFYFQH